MKIQCDVCEKDEAVLFCVADEAALCAACDHRVHHANKLAGKHHRFSLHRPEAPLCDICQEKTAFLFCQQDRAILCSDCDISIHKANKLTQKHTRFLITGIKLSPNPNPYSDQPLSSESTNSTNNKSSAVVPKVKKPENAKPVCSIAPACTHPKANCTTAQSTPALAPEKINDDPLMGFDCSASSISEYVETLPGWHVEDLLHSYSPSPYGFSKYGGDEMLQQFWDQAEIQGNMSAFSTGKMGFGVPPLQQQTHNQSYQCMDQIDFGLPYGSTEQAKGFVMTNYDNGNNNINNNNNNSYIMIKPTRNRSEDNCFAVPQFTPHLNVSKR